MYIMCRHQADLDAVEELAEVRPGLGGTYDYNINIISGVSAVVREHFTSREQKPARVELFSSNDNNDEDNNNDISKT